MAKKAKKAAAKSSGPTAKERAEIEQILDQMKVRVLQGMSPNVFKNSTVERGLRITMRPKILRRMRAGGKWAKEKERPLLVAEHMGQIAKILAKGSKVDLNVANAARVAVKSDENCQRQAAGGGDWCF
jgi:hypothetical protein